MDKELELWQFVAARLEKRRPITLLVVAESSGSSPGRQGFKMAVCGEEMCGSIGGGVMEIRLVELAKGKSKKLNGKKKESAQESESASRDPQSSIIKQVHQKNSPSASGMICSGRQTVIFYELRKKNLKTVREILSALKNNEQRFLKITNEEFRLLSSPGKKPPKGETQDRDRFVYKEKLGFKQNLFIIGGGHCALALSEQMAKFDFHISLFDDRPALNTIRKNKFAHRITRLKSYEDIAENIPEGDDNYVVVMTLGYVSDKVVMQKLLGKKYKYFGVMGSKAKMKTLLRELEKEGFPKKEIAKIHTPIGLPINSRTPAEIAVSIAAQIIAVKNSGK